MLTIDSNTEDIKQRCAIETYSEPHTVKFFLVAASKRQNGIDEINFNKIVYLTRYALSSIISTCNQDKY